MKRRDWYNASLTCCMLASFSVRDGPAAILTLCPYLEWACRGRGSLDQGEGVARATANAIMAEDFSVLLKPFLITVR